MKRLALVVVMSLAAGSLPADGRPGNPVVRMFPANVVYRQSFDDGTLIPDVGRVAKVPDPKRCKFAEGGVFGRCLAAGSVHFGNDADGEPLLNTLSPGTLICWARYVQDPPNGEHSGFIYFLADMIMPKGQRGRLMMLKLNDRGMAGLCEFFAADGKRTAKSASIGLSYSTSWMSPWPKGEWRMFALTWGGNRLTISQNGADADSCVLDRSMSQVELSEIRAPGIREKGRFYQLDEVTVLDRELSKGELRKLYEETMKCRNSK